MIAKFVKMSVVMKRASGGGKPRNAAAVEKKELSRPKNSVKSFRTAKRVKKRYRLIKSRRKHNQTKTFPGLRLRYKRRRLQRIKYRHLKRRKHKNPVQPIRNLVQAPNQIMQPATRNLIQPSTNQPVQPSTNQPVQPSNHLIQPPNHHPIQAPSNSVQELHTAVPAIIQSHPGDIMTIHPVLESHPIPLTAPTVEGHEPHSSDHIYNAAPPEGSQEYQPAAVSDITATAILPDNATEQANEVGATSIRDLIMSTDIAPDPVFVNLLAHTEPSDIDPLALGESEGSIVHADTLALIAQQIRTSDHA